MKQEIKTSDAPQALGLLSQATVDEDTKLIFTSGQIHQTSDGTVLDTSIEEQTHQVMKNLQAILQASGVTFDDVLKATLYVTDMKLSSKVNEVYTRYFNTILPAREMVCVKELPLGARLEISMIAQAG